MSFKLPKISSQTKKSHNKNIKSEIHHPQDDRMRAFSSQLEKNLFDKISSYKIENNLNERSNSSQQLIRNKNFTKKKQKVLNNSFSIDQPYPEILQIAQNKVETQRKKLNQVRLGQIKHSSAQSVIDQQKLRQQPEPFITQIMQTDQQSKEENKNDNEEESEDYGQMRKYFENQMNSLKKDYKLNEIDEIIQSTQLDIQSMKCEVYELNNLIKEVSKNTKDMGLDLPLVQKLEEAFQNYEITYNDIQEKKK